MVIKLTINNTFKQKRKKVQNLNSGNVDGDIYNGMYIPKRFRNAVLKHLLLNYSSNFNNFSPPLLLGIQGPMGEGKSFMIKQICQHYDINCILISGAELCGKNEGDSIKKLDDTYKNASVEAHVNRNFHCIVIDDFHKSIAASEQQNVNRTSNSDTLVGRLMNLADHPYVVDNRIPIILTANTFATTYSPLLRNGRMELFEWTPNISEKEVIVYHIFKKYYPDIKSDVIKQLVSEYKDYYVAFFQSIAQDLFWKDCYSTIDHFYEKRENLNLDNITDFVKDGISTNCDLSLDNLLRLADERSKNIPKRYD